MKKLYLILTGLLLPMIAWATDAKTTPYTSALYQDTEWTAVDYNKDGYVWSDIEKYEAIRSRWTTTQDIDDWFVSPAIHLQAGRRYLVSVNLMTSSTIYTQNFKMMLASSSEVTDLKNGTTLFDTGSDGTAPGYTWTVEQGLVTIDTEGDYYVGLCDYSPKNHAELYLKDFSIDEYVEVPSAPTGLTASVSGKTVALSWTLPTTNNAGGELSEPLTAVQVYRDDALVETLDGTATSWTDDESKGLVLNKSHKYKVYAVLVRYTSAASEEVGAYVSGDAQTLPWTSDFSSSDAFYNAWASIRGANSTLAESAADWLYQPKDNITNYIADRAKFTVPYSAKADEWLIGPALNFEKAGTYKLTVEAANAYGSFKNISYLLGTGGTVSDFTQTIADETALTNAKTAYTYIFNVSAPGTYYLAAHCEAGGSYTSDTYYIYSFSVEEKVAGTPAQVADLAATVGDDQISLSWTYPSKDSDGADLDVISKVEIYRDDVLMETYGEVTPGSAATWVDESPNNGVNTYWVLVYNYSGVASGDPMKVSAKFGNVATLPYTANFFNWTKTTSDWEAKTYSSVGDRAYFNLQSSDTDVDSWFLGELINFEAKHVYDFDLSTYTSYMGSDYNVIITSGKDVAAEGQTEIYTITAPGGVPYSKRQSVHFTLRAVADGDTSGADGFDGTIPAGVRCIAFHATTTGSANIINFKITENAVSSVNAMRSDNGYTITDNVLTLSAVASRIVVADLSGKTVASASNADSLYLGSLSDGVYIFNAVVGGQKIVGKFVK